jgi:hypothetical protein
MVIRAVREMGEATYAEIVAAVPPDRVKSRNLITNTIAAAVRLGFLIKMGDRRKTYQENPERL